MTPKTGSAGVSAPTDPPPMTGPRRRSGLWATMGLGLLLCGAIALWHLVPWSQLQIWAAQEQRGFQTAMAGALRAIRGGDPFAIWTLCLATAAYGFVHAVGPGHGKVLLGGAALASGATLRRMAILTLSASLAQSAFAIILVGGIGSALGWATQDLVGLTEAWLAPASAFAVSALGLVLVIRGVRGGRTIGLSPIRTAMITPMRDRNAGAVIRMGQALPNSRALGHCARRWLLSRPSRCGPALAHCSCW